MPKFIDITNTENDYFYIFNIAFARPIKSNHNLYFYHCKCKKCGCHAVVRKQYLQNGHSKSCGCTRKIFGKGHRDWKGAGDISSSRFSAIINSAKKRKLEFKIDINYAWELFQMQNGLCALTGLPITLGTTNKKRGNASMDRIDNEKGYIYGNVRWVLTDVNLMKRTLSDNDLILYCEKILETHKKKQN